MADTGCASRSGTWVIARSPLFTYRCRAWCHVCWWSTGSRCHRPCPLVPPPGSMPQSRQTRTRWSLARQPYGSRDLPTPVRLAPVRPAVGVDTGPPPLPRGPQNATYGQSRGRPQPLKRCSHCNARRGGGPSRRNLGRSLLGRRTAVSNLHCHPHRTTASLIDAVTGRNCAEGVIQFYERCCCFLP